MRNLILAFAMALLGGLVSIGAYKYFDNTVLHQPIQQTESNVKAVNLISGAPVGAVDYVTAAEMTVNTVVHVKTQSTREFSRIGYDPFREFLYGNGRFEQRHIQPIRGSGSGVIISPDGYIVTNNHVVANADKINVTLNNNRTYEAQVIGLDENTDLAVLKIKENSLPYITYGNSDEVRVGEWVLAVGNPFNLTSTVTAGIVSAKGRDINILGRDPQTNLTSLESFIQTDAAVNPGNSGGALVNTKGELIGINSAIKSNTGSYTGYSFAIPVNIVKKVVEDIIEFGSVQRAFIGINIRDIDETLAEENQLNSLKGAFVAGLSENGAAEKAGIKKGDVVKAINGFSIDNVTQLQEKIGQFRPGDEVAVTLLRNGNLIYKNVELKNINGEATIVKPDSRELYNSLGARLGNLSPEEMEKLQIDHGVKIEQLLPGKLSSTGMKEGFIILKVDNMEIKNIKDLSKVLQNKKGGVLIEGVYPNGTTAYYGFGL